MRRTISEKYIRVAKRLVDENNIDLAEIKLDILMHRLMRLGWMSWFLSLPIVKSILASRPLSDIEAKLRPHLRMILTVIGWISVVSGIVGFFLFLVSLTGIGFAFSFGIFVGIRALLFILFNNLVFSLVSFVNGIGLIQYKKWAPFTSFLSLLIALITFIISLIPIGFSELSTSSGVLGSFINLVLMLFLFAVVHKNAHDFTQ